MFIIARGEQDLLSQVNLVESCPSLPGGNKIITGKLAESCPSLPGGNRIISQW